MSQLSDDNRQYTFIPELHPQPWPVNPALVAFVQSDHFKNVTQLSLQFGTTAAALKCDSMLQVSSAVGQLSGGGDFATYGYLGDGLILTTSHCLQHAHSNEPVLQVMSTCETEQGYTDCLEGSTNCSGAVIQTCSSHNAERCLKTLAVILRSKAIGYSLKSLLDFAMCNVQHVYEGQQLVAIHVSASTYTLLFSCLALLFAQVIMQVQQNVVKECQQIDC